MCRKFCAPNGRKPKSGFFGQIVGCPTQNGSSGPNLAVVKGRGRILAGRIVWYDLYHKTIDRSSKHRLAVESAAMPSKRIRRPPPFHPFEPGAELLDCGPARTTWWAGRALH